MRNLIKATSFWASLVCLPSLSFAGESDVAPTASHDLGQLIASAIQNYPDLEALRGRMQVGIAKEGDLSWWDSPEMRLGYGRDTNVDSKFESSEHPNHQYDASLRVFPRNPWERRATHQKFQSETHLNDLALQMGEQQLTAQVKDSYWELTYLSAEAAMHEEVLSIYKEQGEGMQTLLDNGQITVSQSLPSQMKQLDAVLEMDAYQRAISNKLNELALLSGVEKTLIRSSQPRQLTQGAFIFAYDSWEQRALDHRLELKNGKGALAYTEAELKVLRAKDLPWVKHLAAGYRARNDYGDRDSAAVEVAIDLPFFVSDNGAKAAAQSTLNSQRRQLAQNIAMIRAEVRSLADQFRSLKKEWSAMDSDIVPLMDALSESIKLMKQQQALSNRNYWDARIALLELSKKKLQMAHSYQKLLLKAERVLGQSL
ncbi:MAG TPA: hypothetical protein DCX06_13320 [Opitutae bacterium]|jgi:outer membrane protein TolC|nr:hypothetical protein [Opitutae bacterium]